MDKFLKKGKNSKFNFVVVILVVLLVLSVGYIVIDKYFEYKKAKQNELFERGYNVGVSRANQYIVNKIVTDINQYGQTSVSVPVAENKTSKISLIPLSTIISSINENGVFSFNTFDNNNESIKVDLILPKKCNELTDKSGN